MQQDAEGRALAFEELEKAVIQIAVTTSGPIQLPEQLTQLKARNRKAADEAAAA
jgi:hypothetical protein